MNSRDLKSWCDKHQLKIEPKKLKIVYLKGYKLEFTHYSETRKGGTADIIKNSSDSKVWGVLFEIDDSSLDNLDKKEGTKKEVYRRIEVTVYDEEGNSFAALTYEVAKREFKPSKEYLDIIIEGAKEHNLPREYIESLKKIEVCDK